MSTLKEICKEQTEMIYELRQNIKELTEENETLCKPDVVFELQKDLQERCDRAIALKEENDSMIDEMVMLKAKVNRLEREKNEIHQKLMAQTEVNTAHIAHIKRLEREKENHKAKAFDEVRKYVLNNHDEFEDRKDRARNPIEYDYFSTLQIANNAVINKCKQLERVHDV